MSVEERIYKCAARPAAWLDMAPALRCQAAALSESLRMQLLGTTVEQGSARRKGRRAQVHGLACMEGGRVRAEARAFILLFVATFPVFVDTVFKDWIFRYLIYVSHRPRAGT
jgi:hypothetical protein